MSALPPAATIVTTNSNSVDQVTCHVHLSCSFSVYCTQQARFLYLASKCLLALLSAWNWEYGLNIGL